MKINPDHIFLLIIVTYVVAILLFYFMRHTQKFSLDPSVRLSAGGIAGPYSYA
ncbi:MAG TPA: hypothetical protein VLE02_02080 [Nitrosarchaeum sp.]|nr:hypothetical protein [Nitrosarchaeum sp.]